MSGHPFLMAYDGEDAWHINAFFEIDWPWRMGSQDRILEIDKVEINADLDDELFAFPAPPGMDRLAPLVG